MARYGCIVLMFLLGCVCIIGKLSITTIVEAKEWNERAAREMADTSIIYPTRGSILSANGNILACNQTLYDIRIDLRHPKFTKIQSRTWAAIDSLADSLDIYYPRVKTPDNKPVSHGSPDSWRYLFHSQFAINKLKERKSTATIGTKLTLEDYERIRQWPFFKDIKSDSHRCPLYKEDHIVRVYPFGEMATLSIGRVYEDKATGQVKGYAGLEMALDEQLYGKPGRARKVALTNGLSDWVDIPPVRGYDILTTIDIDLQDILEEELLKMCDSVNAYWGTAVLMEVSTGEIKAISNVELDSTKTKYIEAMNRAVQAYEPGSVMKTISLMLAFEDGIVNKVTDTADCSDFQRTKDHAGGGMKTMKQIIETSSNTGIARVIFRKYSNDPQGFRRRLAEMGFFEPMNSGIGGETTPRVPDLVAEKNGHTVKMAARHLDLARQAYGYNTEIPPLYTLAYYNAIANHGKLVRPHLVRALRDEEGHDSILPITYIRDQVCSPETAEKLKECLYEVVWGKRGTGRALKDDRVIICGKTGTVKPFDYETLHRYDESKRRFAFCGFFPYENPRYSCIVLMQTDAGVTSAARGPGRVLLNTALKLFARGLLNDVSTSYTATKAPSVPQLYGSTGNYSYKVSQTLGMTNARQIKVASSDKDKVPDVTGMDAASAVRELESRGISVEQINGAGYVISQSLKPGTPIQKGQKCSIRLTWKNKQ